MLGIIVAFATANGTLAAPTTSATTTSCATDNEPSHPTTGTDTIAQARTKSIVTWTARSGNLDTYTPAGSPSTSHGKVPPAVMAATLNADA
jgi:hypothetical protein